MVESRKQMGHHAMIRQGLAPRHPVNVLPIQVLKLGYIG